MLTTRDLVFGVLLPALVSAIVLAAARWPQRRDNTPAGGCWAGAAAVAGGFAAGVWGLFGGPPFPPIDSTDWLFYLAFALIVCGALDGAWASPRLLRYAAAVCVCATTTWLLLRPLFASTWSAGTGTAWIVCLTAVASACWIALDELSGRDSGASLPLPLFLIAAAASIVLVLSASLKLGQLGGALTAACGPVALLATRSPGGMPRGAILAFVPVFCGLVYGGHFYASLTGLNAALLLGSPIMCWMTRLLPSLPGPPWLAATIRTIIVVLPAAAAVAFAAGAFGAGTGAGEYEY